MLAIVRCGAAVRGRFSGCGLGRCAAQLSRVPRPLPFAVPVHVPIRIINDVNTILSKNDKIDQSQKAKVYFKTFSASSCDFFIYAFTLTKDWEEFLSIKQDILLKVAEIIEKHDAEIAYPTTTVFINKD